MCVVNDIHFFAFEQNDLIIFSLSHARMTLFTHTSRLILKKKLESSELKLGPWPEHQEGDGWVQWMFLFVASPKPFWLILEIKIFLLFFSIYTLLHDDLNYNAKLFFQKKKKSFQMEIFFWYIAALMICNLLQLWIKWALIENVREWNRKIRKIAMMMRLLRNFPCLKNVGKYEMLFKIELLLLRVERDWVGNIH